MTRLLPLLALSLSLPLALACASAAPPQPVPDVAAELQRQVERVDKVVWEVEQARRIRAAEDAVLVARTRKERAVAMKGLVAARRMP